MLALQNIKPETIRSPIIQQIVDVIVCDSRTIIFVFGVHFAAILWGTSKMISLKKKRRLRDSERSRTSFGSIWKFSTWCRIPRLRGILLYD